METGDGQNDVIQQVNRTGDCGTQRRLKFQFPALYSPLICDSPNPAQSPAEQQGQGMQQNKKGRSAVSTPLPFGTGGAGERQHEGGL